MSVGSSGGGSQSLGGPTRCGWVLGPSLDKIIKNVAWRKHSHLVNACKSALDKLHSLSDAENSQDLAVSGAPLFGFNESDGELLLQPLVLALETAYPKVVEPALDCVYKLFGLGLIRGCEVSMERVSGGSKVVFDILEAVCKCGGLGDEAIELAVLKVLLSAVRSPAVLIRGDCLVDIVKSCYNVYLGGLNGTNQICAKAVLAQMMIIVFMRVEVDSMVVQFKSVVVGDLLEFSDRNLNEGSSIQFAQNFVNEAVQMFNEGRFSADSMQSAASTPPAEVAEHKKGDESPGSLSDYTKIREDGLMLFKNLCKLSMKFSSQEQPDDEILLRGKTLSLELLKVIMDNAGSIWRTNERFLNNVKQYLCLSLLKNSALSVMTIFQLLCSIFENFLTKFRSGLKSEIGIFFPMLILRVLENVLQPSFLQKMTILNLLEKISQDPEIVIDIFVNYDCDVDAPNIFERTVNGLLKTALGPPPGSATTLSPAHDLTFRLESVKCLVSIIKSMGLWMDQQLKIGDFFPPSSSDDESRGGDESNLSDYDLQSEAASEYSDAATLEQRRAYKLEVQKGVSLFNKKPSKGIDFLIRNKRISGSPEAVVDFLKNTSGLNEAMIGDYLGEREEFSLKVMHAYVDSFNFGGMDFGEAIRFFLRGFRLPGEAQKIDRIMEKFAERYCKCNPTSFTSADTAYVLAYSVIMLNTDAHNTMVKDKMTKADFIRNNRGIDDGKDLAEEYLGDLYDQIVRNEIKMKADMSVPQSKQSNNLNRLLGLDGILNFVWKQTEEKPLGANGAIISIAIEDGNYLQEAWEHILTCLSRFEHLQLLGEGAPSDASFFTTQNGEPDEKSPKSSSLRKKGTLQDPAVMAVVRGGSYDSTSRKSNTSGLVTPEQISNFISNLNLLDQVGSFELNHIFAHSQRLKSEAIVAFVKALCKVSMSELQSPTDPRVFSLTKIVEVAHYNMNRIRLVWSRIWSVLSNFFVSVGLSENLSVAIFVMDSLRQLAMKFLEREELGNYNFQNEFLMPFVIIMQKSSSAEIRELIVRCISQMVLTRVNNVKSGWKSVFMVFTAAAADERKNIVLLAFQTMEKIVREYFPHITEVEAVTFTDCVKCLITFTSSRFNSDVSLNAIAFLRFFAVKLADGGLTLIVEDNDDDSSVKVVDGEGTDGRIVTSKESYWIPLLTGLSRLTSDPRSAIRKSALEVLFNILKDHGHLFSQQFWISIFSTVIYPVFESASNNKESHVQDQSLIASGSPLPQSQPWDSETIAVAAQCLVDIFVSFYTVVRSQLVGLVSILAVFITSTGKGYASTGVGALMRLVKDLGSRLLEDEWKDIFLALNKTAVSTFPGMMRLIRTLDNSEMPDDAQVYLNNSNLSSNNGFDNDDAEDDNLQTAGYIISRIKSHVAALLLIMQVITDIYKSHQQYLSSSNVKILLDTFSSIASHAHHLNCETTLQLKLQRACSILEISDPPIVHFENESYENYLNFVHDLLMSNPSLSKEMNIEQLLVSVCETVVQLYLSCASSESASEKRVKSPIIHWILPLGSARREELAARTSLLLSALRILNGMERDSFKRYVSIIFPLLVDLVRSEHSSGEVQTVLSSIFRSCIGPIIMNS
ncbi:hypothetical protein DCAR_0206082 [Daucus carota subsp. sativus]|uniref:SEC7 domain-containing protein n=1 Tax=Daucus carota subsp. sativus TaxID=79200 RepID=A0AAF1AL97_DAUCS|nr:hypothetical protein DCAR_0206082 [Daucus carota subsp. sativus]